MMKRKILFIFLILIFTLSKLGCAGLNRALKEKFVRKKKEKEEIRQVIKAGEEEVYPNKVRYKLHYVYWDAWMTELINYLGGSHKKDVADCRRALEDLKKMADGRVLTASQALEAKLIDEIGYFDKALETILELASLPEANVVSYTYFPKRKTNIYATSLMSTSPLDSLSFRDMIQSLKSGFYYLWHPQLND